MRFSVRAVINRRIWIFVSPHASWGCGIREVKACMTSVRSCLILVWTWIEEAFRSDDNGQDHEDHDEHRILNALDKKGNCKDFTSLVEVSMNAYAGSDPDFLVGDVACGVTYIYIYTHIVSSVILYFALRVAELTAQQRSYVGYLGLLWYLVFALGKELAVQQQISDD